MGGFFDVLRKSLLFHKVIVATGDRIKLSDVLLFGWLHSLKACEGAV